ncbi:HpcH/HpaI aldolase/citrate lyase family protein [Clostridium sp. CCUG 7971]|uniref:HpcH/HpaI aldolase/citrate lyase family protein n=1 Tax=Clostridium sp. CCUG 7971 TaxID=2811414 RepID=UPI001ABA67E3|nr:HpcH/HpaI aldolase/citrate lyase family protein [Clostridium sp. CCUG 7971]MBO3443380.1 HpcH/HpaI aldolase/citrate lyase family protein [Clostridium sp. CCUG 7971]
MRYFDYINKNEIDKIFFKKPIEFDNNTEVDILKYALGAFLYVPATQYNMIYKSITGQVRGVRPLAICLEDAIGINGEKEAIYNLKLILENLSSNKIRGFKTTPLIFIRIRNVEQLIKIKDIIVENKEVLTGILIPKANANLVEGCIEVLDSTNIKNLYVIPIIESREFICNETKGESFNKLYNTLLNHKERILNIRIGVTDILGMYSIRRSKYFSIYDNLICSSFITDVINYLNRDELDIPISGGVSELFDMENEEIKNKYLKEILLDKFHGLVGKTVIHPNQIPLVQALCTVKYEDYIDAETILSSVGGKFGVNKGACGGRMNEINPHLLWAKKIMILSQIYGVLNEGVEYDELFKI